MNENKTFLKRRIGVVLLVCLAIVVIIVVGVLLWTPRNNASLVVSVAPVDADVVINGQTYDGNGVFRNLAPGHYVAVVSKEGFEDKMVEFDLENDKIVYLNEYLMQSDSGFDYYETDSDSLLVLREYAEKHEEDTELKEFLEDYDKKKVILDILPLKYKDEVTNGFYIVDYMEKNVTCKTTYCITISTSDDVYTDAAFAAMKAHGFDLKDYNVIDLSDRCD